MTKRRLIARVAGITAGLGLLLIALGGGADLYLHSTGFQTRVRRLVTARLEAATGAQVDIGSSRLSLAPLQLDLGQVVIRSAGGPAPAWGTVVPKAHLQLRLLSLWRRQVSLDQVVLTEPQLRLDLPATVAGAPGGTVGGGTRVLADIGARRFEVVRGTLALHDRTVPLDFDLHDCALLLLRAGGGVYQGSVRYAGGRLALPGLAPLDHSATVQFSLTGDRLAIEHLQARANAGTLDFEGAVASLNHPVLAGQFRLQGDIAQWAALGGKPAWLRGAADVSGTLRWSGQAWTVTGGFSAGHLIFTSTGWRESSWKIGGTFSAGAAGLVVPAVWASGFGAEVRGQMAVPTWRQISGHGHLRGLSVTALLPLLRARGLDPRVLAVWQRLSGVVGGGVTVAMPDPWRRPTDSTVDLDLAVAPGAAGMDPGSWPLGGVVQARLDGAAGRIDVRHLALQVPALSLDATGSWDGDVSTVAITLSSTDLSPLAPLLRAWGGPDNLSGVGTLRGTLTGGITAPAFNGALQLRHFHYGPWQGEELEARGSIAPGAAAVTALRWQKGAQQVQASGQIALQRYRIADDSRLTVAIQTTRVDLRALEDLAGLDFPVSGLVALQATLSGTRAHPLGSGDVLITAAHWNTQAVRSLRAHFSVANDQLATRDLTLTLARTGIAGSFSAGLSDHSFRLELASPAVDLAEVAVLQSQRLVILGQLRFYLSGTGTWEHPQATMTLATTDLRGGGESLGDVRARVQVADGQAQYQASDVLPSGSLQIRGTAGTSAPYPLQAHVQLQHYDFDAWLRRFTPAELSGHSQMSGTAEIAGPLAQPANLTAQVALDPVEVALSGLTLHNEGPLRIEASQHAVTLAPAHIVGQDTDFTAAARAEWESPLASATRLSGTLQGSINLSLLHALHPTTHAAGEVRVDAQLGGTVGQPALTGQVMIAGASLAEENFPIAFDGIEGDLSLAGGRLQINRLTAQTGSGTISLSGYAARTERGSSIDLSAQGQNLRVRYQGISATGNTHLRLAGQRGSALLSGDAQLTRLAVTPDFDLALFIAGTQTETAPPNPGSLLSQIRLDVHLVTGPQVELATNLAHLQLQGDLRLRGTLANPAILGRASASEGRVLFGGNEYQVDKAQVQFINPYRIQPLLDIGLSATVQQYDVTLNLTGPVDKLAINYRSDPPLSSSDILALLATGQPTQASSTLSQNGNNGFAGQSGQLLGQALDNIVAGRMQRLFGITQVQVDPYSGPLGATGSGGTVTVQQQVSRNLKLTYTQNLVSSAQDVIQIDWTISKLLGVTLARDEFGLYGLKFTFRHRAR